MNFVISYWEQIDNVNDFGNSWKYGTDTNCDCTPDTCPDNNPCDDNVGANDVCLPIKKGNMLPSYLRIEIGTKLIKFIEMMYLQNDNELQYWRNSP